MNDLIEQIKSKRRELEDLESKLELMFSLTDPECFKRHMIVLSNDFQHDKEAMSSRMMEAITFVMCAKGYAEGMGYYTGM